MRSKPSVYFRQERFALLLVILLQLGFLIYFSIKPIEPLKDSLEYLQASENIYRNGQLYCGHLNEPLREALYTRRTPFYPLVLGPAVLFGSSFSVFLIQGILSLLSIFLVYRIFFHKQKIPPLAGLLVLVLMPAQFIYSNLVMAEVLFQFLLVGMAWLFHRLIKNWHNDKLRSTDLVWLTILFTVGMATKPVLYPLALILIPLAIWFFIRLPRRSVLLILLLPLLWISLYSMRNHERTGSYEYSSIQATNLVNYNLRYYLIGKEGKAAADLRIDSWYAEAEQLKSYAEQSIFVKGKARELILEQALAYGFYHLRGIPGFFLDPGRFDLVHGFGLSSNDGPGLLHQFNENGIKGIFTYLGQQGWGLVIILLLIFAVKLLKLAGFLLFLFQGKHTLAFRIFMGVLVFYLAAVTGPLGASRFLLPVELLYSGAALLGIFTLTFPGYGKSR